MITTALIILSAKFLIGISALYIFAKCIVNIGIKNYNKVRRYNTNG